MLKRDWPLERVNADAMKLLVDTYAHRKTMNVPVDPAD